MILMLEWFVESSIPAKAEKLFFQEKAQHQAAHSDFALQRYTLFLKPQTFWPFFSVFAAIVHVCAVTKVIKLWSWFSVSVVEATGFYWYTLFCLDMCNSRLLYISSNIFLFFASTSSTKHLSLWYSIRCHGGRRVEEVEAKYGIPVKNPC